MGNIKCYHKTVFTICLLLIKINKQLNWYWDKRWLFSIGNGAEIGPLEMDRKTPGFAAFHMGC